MKNVILFGATKNCKKYISSIPKDILILAIADNDRSLSYFAGHKVIPPEEIVNYEPNLTIAYKYLIFHFHYLFLNHLM